MAGYSQTLLDELRVNYARGVLSVGHGDKRVVYADGADMLRRIHEIERALVSPTPPPNYRRTTFQGIG